MSSPTSAATSAADTAPGRRLRPGNGPAAAAHPTRARPASRRALWRDPQPAQRDEPEARHRAVPAERRNGPARPGHRDPAMGRQPADAPALRHPRTCRGRERLRGRLQRRAAPVPPGHGKRTCASVAACCCERPTRSWKSRWMTDGPICTGIGKGRRPWAAPRSVPTPKAYAPPARSWRPIRTPVGTSTPPTTATRHRPCRKDPESRKGRAWKEERPDQQREVRLRRHLGHRPQPRTRRRPPARRQQRSARGPRRRGRLHPRQARRRPRPQRPAGPGRRPPPRAPPTTGTTHTRQREKVPPSVTLVPVGGTFSSVLRCARGGI